MLSLAPRFRLRLVNLVLLTCSAGLALFLGEGLARFFLDPGEYLAPKLVPDDSLGQRIEPFSAGHDAWGFRNRAVPEQVDIVAIGDSQTYGNRARASEAWPAALAREIGKSVYNMGLGGYGPVEYLLLLNTRAISLKPRMIIAGFYYGNDLWGAFQSASESLKVAAMERLGWERAEIDSTLNLPQFPVLEASRNRVLRKWLAQHSILYRLFTFHLAEGLRNLEMRLSSRRQSDILILDDREHDIHTGFSPRIRFMVLDQGNRQVRAGLQISLQTLGQMDELCRRHGILFLVALIPTKESVFAPYVQDHSSVQQFQDFERLVEEERQVNSIMKSNLTANGIRFVDCLPALQEAVLRMSIYPSNEDGHPNPNGYRIIARAVAQALAP